MAKAIDLAESVERMASELDDEVQDALEDGADTTARATEATIEENNSVAHGNLLAGITTRDADDDIIPSGEAGAHVVSTMPYSGFVEYGTGSYNTQRDPFKSFKSPDPAPPIGPIRQWVIRKGITAKKDALRTRTDEQFANDVPLLIAEQENLARAIADLIGALGNRSHPFMRPAFHSSKDAVFGGVVDATRDTIEW